MFKALLVGKQHEYLLHILFGMWSIQLNLNSETG